MGKATEVVLLCLPRAFIDSLNGSRDPRPREMSISEEYIHLVPHDGDIEEAPPPPRRRSNGPRFNHILVLVLTISLAINVYLFTYTRHDCPATHFDCQITYCKCLHNTQQENTDIISCYTCSPGCGSHRIPSHDIPSWWWWWSTHLRAVSIWWGWRGLVKPLWWWVSGYCGSFHLPYLQ